MNCRTCKEEIDEKYVYCPMCGALTAEYSGVPDLKLVSKSGSFVDAIILDKNDRPMPLSDYLVDVTVNVGLDKLVEATLTFDMVGLDLMLGSIRLSPEQIELLENVIECAKRINDGQRG